VSDFRTLQDRVLNHFGYQDSEARDECKNRINETIDEIEAEIPRALHTQGTDTFTTTSGTSAVSSAFPSDYDHIHSVYLTVSGEKQVPLGFLNRRQWNERRLFENEGEPTHYNIWDGVLYLGPKPDDTYTGTIDYYKFSTELSGDTDTTLITDHYKRWEHAIFKGAKAKMYEYQGTDGQLIQKADIEYRRALNLFRAWVNRNLNKSPESSRIRGWKEALYRRTQVDSVLKRWP